MPTVSSASDLELLLIKCIPHITNRETDANVLQIPLLLGFLQRFELVYEHSPANEVFPVSGTRL